MRKLFILCAACLMCIGAMAETETINAVSVTQGTTTDWYRLGNPKKVHVDIAGTSVTFPNKTYNLANGNIETEFGTAPADLWYTVRTDGVAGNWNTICLPNNITAIDGATFWTIVGQDATSFILDEVTEPQAGYGYLIRFTAAELKVKYGDQVAATPVTASDGNPIQGTYTQIDFDGEGKNVLVGNYVVYNNQLCPVEAWVGLRAHRAYVVADLVPNNVPAPAPGRARAYMPKPKETPTGIGQWNKEQGQRTGKFLHNGQLIIVKDNQMFNAQGMKL
ncbi:MAG: hypothetical protein MJZ53_05985 [Paludibacteraceae bacterium]|nr:hypothetical protein [Paludibacteraceae bacterium]